MSVTFAAKSNSDSFESLAQPEVGAAQNSVVAVAVVVASKESNRDNIFPYHHHFHRRHCVHYRYSSQTDANL